MSSPIHIVLVTISYSLQHNSPYVKLFRQNLLLEKQSLSVIIKTGGGQFGGKGIPEACFMGHVSLQYSCGVGPFL